MTSTSEAPPARATVVLTEIVCWFTVHLVLTISLLPCLAIYIGMLVAPSYLFCAHYFTARERAGVRAKTRSQRSPYLWAGLFNLAAVLVRLGESLGGSVPASTVSWGFVLGWIVVPSIVSAIVLKVAGVLDGAIATIPAAVLASATHFAIDGEGWGIAEMFVWNLVVSIGVWSWAIRVKVRSWRSRSECAKCGYSLLGLPTARCPECGRVSVLESS